MMLDRLADRSRVAAVDIVRIARARGDGRLIDIVRTVIVAAGEGAARGNEDGSSGKCDLSHFLTPVFLSPVRQVACPWEEFRVARTGWKWVFVCRLPITKMFHHAPDPDLEFWQMDQATKTLLINIIWLLEITIAR